MGKQKQAPAAIVPSGEYEVKGIKTFRGMEGGGYNATLYRSGKRVAAVIDDASGGPLMVDWADWKKPRIAVKTSKYGGKYKATVQMTPEEKALHDYASSLPPLKSSIVSDEEPDGIVMEMDSELFIEELVNQALLLRDLQKLTRGKLAFEVDGKVYTMATRGNEAGAREHLKRRHPSAKLLNDMQVQDALAIIRAMQQ
jgi:hypothetical protein